MHLPRMLLVLLLAAAAGCATGDAPAAESEPPAGLPGTPVDAVTVVVRTTGAYPVNPGYDPARIEVPVGSRVTIELTNAEAAPVARHDWVVEGVQGAQTEVAAAGQTVSVTFPAPAPGEYVFYCSVGDHRERGMEGVFVVAA